MRLTDQAILNLAAQVAPFVRMHGEMHGQLTPECIKDALHRIGRPSVCSTRTVMMIDNYISNYFV